MAYESQNQKAHDRYTDQAFALAEKLGQVGNVLDGFWGKKPKGMHHRTYKRKVAKLDYLTRMGMSCFTGKYEEWIF